MVNQNLKEDSLSTSNFLLKTSKQNLWLHFKELNTTWIFQNLALISNELIKSIKEAHCRYEDELEKQRKQKQESQKSLKCKIVANEINALKEKHIKLISEIEMLCADADLLAVKAEKLHGFCYLTQSNKQKKLADKKQKEMMKLQKMEENLSKKC